ncbi:MAG: DUF4157 domain-containing protein, partial [Pseudomonadota bacterium]
SGRERTAKPPQGQSAPLDRGTRARAESRLGTDLSGVRVARGAAADHATQTYNARALTTGNLVVLGSDAGAQDLGHELVHVAQRARFGTGPAVQSRTSDPAEAEARQLGPQVLSQGGPLAITAKPTARVNRGGGDDEAEPTAQERGWSFDPMAMDVATMDNMTLVTSTLSHREWLANHTILELDWEPHRIALDRLDIERDWRIELGHLWLTDIDEGITNVVQLVAGVGGAIDVVRPPDALVAGGAVDLIDQPIMSTAQFQAMQAQQGYTPMPLDTYLAEVTQVTTSADEPSPNHLESQITIGAANTFEAEEQAQLDAAYRQLFGLSGANSRLSARDTRLPDAFGVQNNSKRVGNLSEVIFGTSAENFYGYRGMLQDESVQQNHPRTDYRRFFSNTDVSVKSRDPSGQAYNDPNRMRRFANYLDGQQSLLGTLPDSNAFNRFMDTSARGRTPQQVRADALLAIDAGDVAAYRDLVGNPQALPHPTATKPTYQQAPVTRIYNGFLQDAPVQPASGGPDITTIAALDDALTTGRITAAEHTAALNRLATNAQDQVIANTEFTSAHAQSFQNAFDTLHPSLRPEAPDTPTRYSSRRSTTSNAASHPSRVQQFNAYLNAQTNMYNSNGTLLHVPQADVAPYQALLRSPFSREASPSGRTTRQNYTLAPVYRVYNGILASTPVRDAAGNSYATIDEINTARDNGALTATQHRQLIDRVAHMAARSVAADAPGAQAAHNRANRAATQEHQARMARANDYIRRAASPEYLASIERGGGMRGDLSVARSYGGRAALLGAFMGAGQEYIFSENGFEDPELRDRMLRAGGREGLRSGLSATGETLAAQQGSRMMLREGMEMGATRAFLIRAGSRAVPGGLVDAGFEVHDILTDGKDNSAGEVTYRTGRAFVIGGSSAWAGAAAGAAVGSAVPVAGTAVGFVVGFLVGMGVGYAANEIIPTYADLQGPQRRRVPFRSSTAIDRALQSNRCPSHHRSRDSAMEIPLMPRAAERS